jgi:hypothetical protein
MLAGLAGIRMAFSLREEEGIFEAVFSTVVWLEKSLVRGIERAATEGIRAGTVSRTDKRIDATREKTDIRSVALLR